MNYYLISYPGDDGENIDEVLSEEDIRRDYWPHWYERMCKRFGKDVVDRDYCFQDCVDYWVIVHWAVKV